MKNMLYLVLTVMFFFSCSGREEENKTADTIIKDTTQNTTIKDTTQTKTHPKHGKSFLWEIKSDSNTVYLLGSVHVANDSLYPLHMKIYEAFQKSKTLVVEMNIKDVNIAEVAEKAVYRDGSTLKDHISPEAFDTLKAAFDRLGLGEAVYGKMKPGYAVITLMGLELQKQGFNPQYGIDLHFINMAEKSGKKIESLETFGQQLNMIEKVFGEYSDNFISYNIDELKSLKEQMDEMLEAWKTGDTGKMEKIINKPGEDNPEFIPLMKLLVDDRNIKMADKIEGFLEKGQPYFVIVGAGHLVGEKGIISILKKTGKYTITQL